MPALAHSDAHLPAPSPTRRPRLRALPAPPPRRIAGAGALALYALGLTAGFLLAGMASLPGGADVVTGQLGLALPAAVMCGLAALRARAVARRRLPPPPM